MIIAESGAEFARMIRLQAQGVKHGIYPCPRGGFLKVFVEGTYRARIYEGEGRYSLLMADEWNADQAKERSILFDSPFRDPLSAFLAALQICYVRDR